MNAADVVAAIRAKHVGCAILTEVSITDPDWLDNWTADEKGYGTSRRIDVLMWRTLVRTAIEVKVSRSDFLRETDSKRRIWREHSHRFVYAAPEGLIHPEEVADGCGLWAVNPEGRIEVIKRARLNRDPKQLPEQVVQAIAYRAMKEGRANAA